MRDKYQSLYSKFTFNLANPILVVWQCEQLIQELCKIWIHNESVPFVGSYFVKLMETWERA